MSYINLHLIVQVHRIICEAVAVPTGSVSITWRNLPLSTTSGVVNSTSIGVVTHSIAVPIGNDCIHTSSLTIFAVARDTAEELNHIAHSRVVAVVATAAPVLRVWIVIHSQRNLAPTGT